MTAFRSDDANIDLPEPLSPTMPSVSLRIEVEIGVTDDV